MTHSLLPWRLCNEHPCDIYDARDNCLHEGFIASDIDEANAALIVHRVNTYEALVEALGELLHNAKSYQDDPGLIAVMNARAALALAKGE